MSQAEARHSPAVLAPARLALPLAFAAAMLAACAILLHFHDHFWWPADEGVYAHVAERILQGEVLNGTVQDIHMGYVNFANALALKLFGLDLVSLRYPLVAMTLVQCALVFWLLAGRGSLVALAGTFAMASLSLLQFLDPTAHWYALFLCMVIVALLSTAWGRRPGGLALVGFLLVTLFLFRQLSGVFAAMGVLTLLLLQREGRAGAGSRLPARLLAGIMLAGLAGYLLAKTDAVAAVLFGAGPALLLGYAVARPGLGARGLWRVLAALALGGLPAVLPLIAYHLAHGTLASWLDDTVVAAFTLTEMAFMAVPSYAYLLLRGLGQALMEGTVAARVNGLFWFVIPVLPLLLGVLLLRALRRGLPEARAALPVVACLYAPVSMHYQIPLYLFYSTALTLAAILYLAPTAGRGARLAAVAGVLALSAVGLHYHAGQPHSRNWSGIIAGTRSATMAPAALPRASLVLPAEEAALYRRLLEIIAAHSRPGEAILALPVNPELYFLGQRRNPLRDPNVAIGLRSEAALAEVQASLRADPPRILFFRPDDKYATPRLRRLTDGLRDDYILLETLGGFEIYLPRD